MPLNRIPADVDSGESTRPLLKPIAEHASFAGWYYIRNRTPRRFEPENVPVIALNAESTGENATFRLFAEWVTHDVAKYKVNYVRADDPETEVAPPTVGRAYVWKTRTFQAKFGDELSGEYKWTEEHEDEGTNWWPTVNSHSIIVKANEEGEEFKPNEYTFTYIQKDKVFNWTDDPHYVSENSVKGDREQGTVDRIITDVNAVQSKKNVFANFRTTPSGAYKTISIPYGSNYEQSENMLEIEAAEEYGGKPFAYLEVRKTENGAVVAKSYEPLFDLCMMDSYWITPVYSENETPESSSPLITLTHIDNTRNTWTDDKNEVPSNGTTDKLFADFEIAFKDGAENIYNAPEGTYRTGVVFELCRKLGADVTAIDDYAFLGDEAITDLSFNSALSLKKIGANAFYGCTGLKSIEVPAWIEQLSFGSFQNCTSLESLLINNGLAEIPVQCFYGCDELSGVTIPQSVKSIGDRAFMNCAKLHDVAIPDSVEYIAANAFDGCDSLVISCSKNSYARKFAAENKIPFTLTDGIAFVLGDANGDRLVNINDVTEIQRDLAELVHLDSVRLKAADSSQDGKTDISDATDLQMFLAEYELTNPIGEIIIE